MIRTRVGFVGMVVVWAGCGAAGSSRGAAPHAEEEAAANDPGSCQPAACVRAAELALRERELGKALAFARRSCALGDLDGCELTIGIALARGDLSAAGDAATTACERGRMASCYLLVELDRALPPIGEERADALFRSACSVQFEPACERVAERARAHQALAERLVAAVAARDVAAFAAIMPDGATLEGAWFDDARCRDAYTGTHVIGPGNRENALACLSTLDHLTVGGGALRYEPGVALDVRVRAGAITALAAQGPIAPVAGAAQISADALDAHRVHGDRAVDPGPTVRDRLEELQPRVWSIHAEARMCIEPTGALSEVTVAPPVSVIAADRAVSADYAERIRAAVKQWQFRPFVVRGQAVRVCGHAIVGYPVERIPRAAAPQLVSEPDGAAPPVLEAQRIAGERNIVPDAETKRQLARAGNPRIGGTFKVCIAKTGAIDSVKRLRSTGYLAYDRAIVRRIFEWRYRPITIKGAPVEACAAVSIIYGQD